MEFEAKSKVDPADIIRLIQEHPELYSFDSKQRLRLATDLEDTDTRFLAAEELLTDLGLNADNPDHDAALQTGQPFDPVHGQSLSGDVGLALEVLERFDRRANSSPNSCSPVRS